MEILVVFFLAAILAFGLWALFALLLQPVFGSDMLSLCFADGDGQSLEMRVRAYGWLRENKKRGGKLVIVDCGLSRQGMELVQHLRQEKPWLDYCPHQALPDYIELLQHCLENGEKL